MNEKEVSTSTVRAENEKKKAYLQKYGKHGRKISRIEAEIEEIRAMKLHPSMSIDGMPHGTNQVDLSDYAAELAEKEESLYLEGVGQVKAYKDITYRINQLKDENERDVLFYRYIKSKSWWEIAETMGYSERQVHRLHGKALAHFRF